MSCGIIDIYSNNTFKSDMLLRRSCVQTDSTNGSNISVNIKSINKIVNENVGHKNTNTSTNKNKSRNHNEFSNDDNINHKINAIVGSKNVKVTIMLILFSVLVCLMLVKEVDFKNRLLSLDPISNTSMGYFDAIINNQEQNFEFLECCKINKDKMFDELIGPFEWDPAQLETFNKETLMVVSCMFILSCYLIL